VAGSKDYLVEHIGRQWDIVGFDPRGIGSTTYVIFYDRRRFRGSPVCSPKVQCFASEQDQINLYTGTVFERGYTYPHMSHPEDSGNRQALTALETEHVAVFKAHSEACKHGRE
jgi:hypothetical protein